tara:strand:+ start:10014 stop:11000 length:987 start_codon:yes stop_codon:yes gene_type:complete
MLNKNKTIIGVACGGFGSEREISLKSGAVVFESLKMSGWNVFLLIVNSKNWHVKISKNKEITLSMIDFSFNYNNTRYKIDVIFNTIHGPPGENGQLASKLKSKNIPHTSCDEFSAQLTYNKRECISSVKKYKIPSAKSVHLDEGKPFDEIRIIEKIGLPCFVKANKAGSSFGVYKITNKNKLRWGIKNAFLEDNEILIESELKGREVSVGVYKANDKIICLPITEIISENDFFDYEAKYLGKAKEITPAEIPHNWKINVTEMAIKLYKNLNLKGVCRSDFIFVNNIPHLIEINTVPGLTKESIIPKQCEAAGIKLNKFFEDLLDEAMA